MHKLYIRGGVSIYDIKAISLVVENITKFKTLKDNDLIKVGDIMEFRQKMVDLGFDEFNDIHYNSLLTEANKTLDSLYQMSDITDISDSIFKNILCNISFFTHYYEIENIPELLEIIKNDLFALLSEKISTYINEKYK